MNKETFFESLDVPLDDDEVRQRGTSLAKKLEEIDSLREAKKSAAAQFKSKIDTAEEELEKLGRQVRTRKEERDVECREVFGGSGIVEIVRLDGHTPVIVRTRGMTEGEIKDSRQGRLFVLDGAGKKASTPAPKPKADKDSNKLEEAPALAPDAPSGDAAPVLDDQVHEVAVDQGPPVNVPTETTIDPQSGGTLVKIAKGRKTKKAAAATAAVADEEEEEGDGRFV